MKGRIYYDEKTLAITGVAFVEPPEFSGMPYMEVDSDVAVEFLSGAKDTGSWRIARSVDYRRLLLIPASLGNLIPTRDRMVAFEPHGQSSAAVTFLFTLPTKGSVAELRVINPTKVYAKGAGISLVIVFTKKNEGLDARLFEVKVRVAELLRQKSLRIELPETIEGNEVSMFALQGLDYIGFEYRVISENEIDDSIQEMKEEPLSLPRGRFDDIVEFAKVEMEQIPPCLLAVVDEGSVSLIHHLGGGRPYDREIETMMLIFSQEGDADAVLGMVRVGMDGKSTTLPFDLPSDYSIYGQMAYEVSCFVKGERRAFSAKRPTAQVEYTKEVRELPIDVEASGYGVGLVVSNDRIMIENGNDKDGMIIFAEPGNPDKVRKVINVTFSTGTNITTSIGDSSVCVSADFPVQAYMSPTYFWRVTETDEIDVNRVTLEIPDRRTLLISCPKDFTATLHFVDRLDPDLVLTTISGNFGHGDVVALHELPDEFDILARMPYGSASFVKRF